MTYTGTQREKYGFCCANVDKATVPKGGYTQVTLKYSVHEIRTSPTE